MSRSNKGKEKEEDFSQNNVEDENLVEWIEPRSNAQVLATQIPWKRQRQAGNISEESLQLLQEYDGKSSEEQAALLEEAPEKYAELFLHLLSFKGEGVASPEVVQHLLAWIDEIIQDEDKIQIFLRCKDPFTPFLDTLRPSSDWFVNSRASRILAHLLAASPQTHQGPQSSLVLWCVGYLRDHKDSIGDLLLATHSLTVLLRKPAYRIIFGNENGIQLLHELLKSNRSSQQMVYKTLFCMWVVSFEPKVAEKFSNYEGLVEEIVEILRSEKKEKITRMAIAVLRNLLVVAKGGKQSGGKENRSKMVESGIVRVLGYLNNRKWGDEDIEGDLEVLTEEVGKDLVKMTSWEVYNQEIRSGELSWTPVHKSEKFWRENVHRFEENNRELVGILLGLIRMSKNPLVRSVALFDIGEFCRFHPKGRKIIADLEGKTDIMFAMNSEPEVAKQALLCVQKMMVHNWEFLSAQQ